MKESSRNKSINSTASEKTDYKINSETMETSTVSMTDCTGALPRPPVSESELHAFINTYQYLPETSVNQDHFMDSAEETVQKRTDQNHSK